MKSKLEILGEVMMSFKNDQAEIMNDINALLTNRDKEVGLNSKLKSKIQELSIVHLSMQETQGFILQMTANQLESDQPKENSSVDSENLNIGSSGPFNNDEHSEK